MLSGSRKRLAYHAQAGMESVRALCHKPVITLLTVMVISISLALPALFQVVVNNLKQLGGDWQHGGHISLYLDASLSSADAATLFERVRTTPGVGTALLKSPADGLAELQQQDGMQDIMQYLPENPLPSMIDVTPTRNMNSSEAINTLYQSLKSYPHVEHVKFDMQWVSRLYALLDIAAHIADGLMLLLAVAVVLIIGNTLRMAILNRHEEIHVLKFIGASNAYIIRPFLYAGVLYGAAGALLAMLMVYLMTLSLSVLVERLAETWQMHYRLMGLSFEQTMMMLLFAMVLGWVAARVSVRSLCRSRSG